MGWVGSGQLFGGLGWTGSMKVDPRTTLVHAVAHHALNIGSQFRVIGSNALFCCARYGWAAADFFRLVKFTFLIQIFKTVCDNFIRK